MEAKAILTHEDVAELLKQYCAYNNYHYVDQTQVGDGIELTLELPLSKSVRVLPVSAPTRATPPTTTPSTATPPAPTPTPEPEPEPELTLTELMAGERMNADAPTYELGRAPARAFPKSVDPELVDLLREESQDE